MWLHSMWLHCIMWLHYTGPMWLLFSRVFTPHAIFTLGKATRSIQHSRSGPSGKDRPEHLTKPARPNWQNQSGPSGKANPAHPAKPARPIRQNSPGPSGKANPDHPAKTARPHPATPPRPIRQSQPGPSGKASPGPLGIPIRTIRQGKLHVAALYVATLHHVASLY